MPTFEIPMTDRQVTDNALRLTASPDTAIRVDAVAALAALRTAVADLLDAEIALLDAPAE